MSGLCGIFSRNKRMKVINYIQYSLFALQHRGQEGFGIVTLQDKKIFEFKRRGLLNEALDEQVTVDMQGSVGLGIVKYAFGHNTRYEPVMPYVFDSKKGNCVVAIDGNISNKDFYVSELVEKINSTDEELREYIQNLEGTFSIVFVSKEKIVAIRDKNGVKPICIGQLDDDTTIVVSESCGIDCLGGKFVRDVKRGEIFIKTREEEYSIFTEQRDNALCLFEMVYIARPDSYIDGTSVYEARYKMGKRLAEEFPTKADVVIGSPDSGLISAKGYAKASGIEYVDGILKNRYIARTFIQPTQKERDQGVNIKLNILKPNVYQKEVILVDDSIVRGTTIKRLVDILKKAGAKKIHIRIASPPVISSESLSIDIPDEKKLISFGKTVEQVREEIGCDSLYFLSLDGIRESCGNKGYYEKYFTGESPIKE